MLIKAVTWKYSLKNISMKFKKIPKTKNCGKRCAKYPKLCGNCTFPQNFHTSKFGEILVFYAVKIRTTGEAYSGSCQISMMVFCETDTV